MARHGGKRRAQPREIKIQYPGALRCVHDQRHTVLSAEHCDLPDRQDESEYIRHAGAHSGAAPRKRLFKPAKQGLGIEKRRIRSLNYRAGSIKRTHDGVMLKTGDGNARPLAYKRADSDIECVCGVHGKDDVFGLRHMKERRRFLTAGKNRFRSAHGGGMIAAAGARAAVHGARHSACHLRRLLQRCRRAVQIDHSGTSRYSPVRRERRNALPRSMPCPSSSATARRSFVSLSRTP